MKVHEKTARSQWYPRAVTPQISVLFHLTLKCSKGIT